MLNCVMVIITTSRAATSSRLHSLNMYMIRFAFFLDSGPKASHHRKPCLRYAEEPLIQLMG